MGIMADTVIADASDAEVIAKDKEFYGPKSKYNRVHSGQPEFFDTLLYILRGKKRRVKPLTACKLLYSDRGTWMYQVKSELIELLANSKLAEVRTIAQDVVELSEGYQAWIAAGMPAPPPPTDAIRDLRKQCEKALAQDKTILLRVNL